MNKLVPICLTFLLILVFSGFTETTVAQPVRTSGKITDAASGEPLAFVNISVKGMNVGTTTNLSGNFQFEIPDHADSLVFTYVGYERKTVKAYRGFKRFTLKTKAAELDEVVVIPGKNPADSIMSLAAKNRKHNNPKNYDQYVYEMYNKVLVTIDDSAAYKLMNSEDTTDQNFGKHLKDHELFISETYSQNLYKKPGRVREDVIANRVSGLQRPSFYFLATQFQPFSFYDDQIELSGKKFLNPVSKNASRDYLFILEDTLYRDHDTVFVIKFQPRSDRHFKALEGMISINTDGYAVENVIARSADDRISPLRIRQKYEKVKGKWFPNRLDFDIEFNELIINGYPVTMEGKSRIKNVAFDTALRRRDFSAVTTRLDPDASNKSDDEWNALRGDTLDLKEDNAYRFNDSVGAEADLDKKMLIFESLATGKVPIKFVDLDLGSIMDYNPYEGFRLGAGLYTNNKVSRHISGGGYFAYGFNDKTSKYGGRLDFKLRRINEIKLRLSYTNDVLAPGYHDYGQRNSSLINYDLTQYFINWMNRYEEFAAEFTFPAFRYGRINAFSRVRSVGITNNYRFYEPVIGDGNFGSVTAYNTFESGFLMRYSFGEQKAEMFNTVITSKTPNPVFDFGYTFGMNNLSEQFDDYHKFSLRMTHSRLSQRMKKTAYRLEGSYVHGCVPLTEQFGIRSAGSSSTVTVWSPQSFQTVRFAEFFSDVLFQGFLRHELFKIKTGSKKFQPSVNITQAAAWGINVTDRPPEVGWNSQIPEHGLFESGILFDNIYRSEPDSFFPSGYGLSFSYRYGYYNEGPFMDNFAIRISVSSL